MTDISSLITARFAALLGAAAIVAIVLGACTSDKTGFDDSPPSLTPPGSEGGAPEGGGGCTFHCSRDLKKVVKDCGGK